MPYINRERRKELQQRPGGQVPGELNYELIMTVNAYLKARGLSYTTLNDILGALEGCKLEFYRRVVIPYENTKLAQNGDVFE